MQSRSWTDLSSNVTHFGGVQLADHLDDLLRPGNGPPALMLGCLHELTHHWCFNSAVGVAITGLTCRMANTILGEDDRREELVLRDLSAYRTVTAILRPLTEGLAGFAEFDINTLRSTVLSTPLQSAISLFSGRAHPISGPPGDDGIPAWLAEESTGDLGVSLPVVAALKAIRLSEAGIRRKVNVLATRADQDTDGYLLGYLAVKGILRWLRQRCARLYTETDLAFAFVRNFFYEDRRLIEILLAPGAESIELLADRIVQRVRQRKDQLANDVTDEDVATFEGNILNDIPTGSPKWASCLHISLDEWARGQRAHTAFAEDLTTEPRAEEPIEKLAYGIRRSFAVMLNRRHIVHLGAQAVHVEVDDAGGYVVRFGSREMLRGHTPHAAAQSGQGTIELVFSTKSSGLYRAIMVYGPTSLVDIVVPEIQAHDHDHELGLLRTDLYPSTRFVRLGEAIDRVVNSFVAKSALGPLLEIVELQIPDIVRKLYLDCALNTVANERVDDVIRLLDAGGVYALLGHDRDLLEALVILGAVAPLMPIRRPLIQLLAERGFPDPETTLGDLVECRARTGLAVVSADAVRAIVQL